MRCTCLLPCGHVCDSHSSARVREFSGGCGWNLDGKLLVCTPWKTCNDVKRPHAKSLTTAGRRRRSSPRRPCHGRMTVGSTHQPEYPLIVPSLTQSSRTPHRRGAHVGQPSHWTPICFSRWRAQQWHWIRIRGRPVTTQTQEHRSSPTICFGASKGDGKIVGDEHGARHPRCRGRNEGSRGGCCRCHSGDISTPHGEKESAFVRQGQQR